ncbi:MAG: outer membrane lipoprotein carrier protein LolA [Acetobacteraceae bacterium]
MHAALLCMAMMGVDAMDPVAAALERYEDVKAYTVTLKSSARGEDDVIRYAYRRPGHVRMEFVAPHAGMVMIYDPQAAEVRLWPFGPGYFSLTFDPDNRLIRSRTGQRIDRSDFGALLQNVRSLQRSGQTTCVAEQINGRDALHVAVEGELADSLGAIRRYELWLDAANRMPLRVISRDRADTVIEEVWFEELRLDPELPASIFSSCGDALRR